VAINRRRNCEQLHRWQAAKNGDGGGLLAFVAVVAALVRVQAISGTYYQYV
jgi:hypothetical protein